MFLTTRILTRRVISFDEADDTPLKDSPCFLRFDVINCDAFVLNGWDSGTEDENNRLNRKGNIGNFLRAIKVNPGADASINVRS